MRRTRPSGARAAVRVEPVTSENWETFSRLFEAIGGPHYCWCTSYRVRNAAELSGAQKKAIMRSCVDASVPIGVLAIKGDEPVGSGVSSTHRGHSRMFRSARFKIDGRRWFLRLTGHSHGHKR